MTFFNQAMNDGTIDRRMEMSEKEFEMIERRRKEGVPVNKSMQDVMIELKKELKLGSFNFPFFADDTSTLQNSQRLSA